MSEPETQLESRILGGKVAFALGFILICGMSVVSVLAFQDEPRRTTLETLENPTAVGDPVTATLPPKPDQPIVTVHGKAMFAGSTETHREIEAYKAGMDDSGKVFLYHVLNRGKPTPQLWVRVGDLEYAPLLETPSVPPPPQP